MCCPVRGFTLYDPRRLTLPGYWAGTLSVNGQLCRDVSHSTNRNSMFVTTASICELGHAGTCRPGPACLQTHSSRISVADCSVREQFIWTAQVFMSAMRWYASSFNVSDLPAIPTHKLTHVCTDPHHPSSTHATIASTAFLAAPHAIPDAIHQASIYHKLPEQQLRYLGLDTKFGVIVLATAVASRLSGHHGGRGRGATAVNRNRRRSHRQLAL